MLILFKAQNVSRIKFFKQPTSEVLPMIQVVSNPPELDGFTWDFDIRPKSIADLRDATLVMKRSRSSRSASPIPSSDTIDESTIPEQFRPSNRPPDVKPTQKGRGD